MNEPWLRDIEGAWIPSPQNQGVHNLYVSDLMSPNMKVWDRGKIESLFSMEVANRILDIPLFDMLDEDKLVWVDNAYGYYSVKSGYKLMLNVTGKVVDASQQADWHSLWTILAPPKAKHLLWRVCKGCLPTRLRLQEKHVPCPLLCLLCNQGVEDDWHTIFNCEANKDVWNSAGLEDIVMPRLQQAFSAQAVIHDICSKEDKMQAGLFATVVWFLWNNRNKRVWNDVAELGRSIGFKARHCWEEWFMVQNLQHDHIHSAQQQQTHWQPPPHGWFKCNVDAGFHTEVNKTSTGWCLRDHMGQFIRAETTWIDGNCSILEGESLALLEALRVLEQRGITHVIIESDSKSVVDAICHLRGDYSEFSFIISQINNILRCNPNFEVKFVKRQANMVAHTLARAVISWSRRCTFDSLPPCILTLMNNEMH
jgi:ribonuclease HI